MVRYFLLLLLISMPASADTYAVVGVEHISSWFDGTPFNNNKEFSVDMAYAGISHERENWTVDILVAHMLQNPAKNTFCDTTQVYSNNIPVQRLEDCYGVPEYRGSNPRAIFRIERKFKIGK